MVNFMFCRISSPPPKKCLFLKIGCQQLQESQKALPGLAKPSVHVNQSLWTGLMLLVGQVLFAHHQGPLTTGPFVEEK